MPVSYASCTSKLGKVISGSTSVVEQLFCLVVDVHTHALLLHLYVVYLFKIRFTRLLQLRHSAVQDSSVPKKLLHHSVSRTTFYNILVYKPGSVASTLTQITKPLGRQPALGSGQMD